MRKGLSALITAAVSLVPFAAMAATTSKEAVYVCDTSAYKALGGLLTGISAACGACGQCQISDFFIVGNTIAKLILGLSGSIMLLMVVYGGFLWLSSAGNSSMVDKGKKVLIGSIVGLIIVFGAYTATQFILGALGVQNVSEVFTRPFQNAKGKVVAPAATGGTTSGTAPTTGTCVCKVTIASIKECTVGALPQECTSKPPGCDCEIRQSDTAAADCTLDKIVKNLAPSATGSCAIE